MRSMLLLTFIYLPDFRNLMMLHLVLRYRCPTEPESEAVEEVLQDDGFHELRVGDLV